MVAPQTDMIHPAKLARIVHVVVRGVAAVPHDEPVVEVRAEGLVFGLRQAVRDLLGLRRSVDDDLWLVQMNVDFADRAFVEFAVAHTVFIDGSDPGARL